MRIRYSVSVFIAAAFIGLPYSVAFGAGQPACKGDDLSRAALLDIVKQQIQKQGGDPDGVDKNTRVEVSTIDCDYLVRLTFLPEKPGSWTIYRISRASKVVDTMAGH